MSRPWSKPEPLRAPIYARLVDQYVRAEDRHDRYRLLSLIGWHVPVPWRGWRAFWRNAPEARAVSEVGSTVNNKEVA